MGFGRLLLKGFLQDVCQELCLSLLEEVAACECCFEVYQVLFYALKLEQAPMRDWT